MGNREESKGCERWLEVVKKDHGALWIKMPLLAGFIAEYADCTNMPAALAGISEKGELYVSPQYLRLRPSERLFVLAHEALHALLRHHSRFKAFERKHSSDKGVNLWLVWNLATDALINELLRRDGWPPPSGVILPESLKSCVDPAVAVKMSAEELAEKILECAKRNPAAVAQASSSCKNKHGYGVDLSSGDPSDERHREDPRPVEDRGDFEAEFRGVSESAKADFERLKRYERMRQAGFGPGSLVLRLAEESGRVDWRSLFRRVLTEWGNRVRRDWRRLSARVSGSKIVTPRTRKLGVRAHLLLDVSGSMMWIVREVLGEARRAARTADVLFAYVFDDGLRRKLTKSELLRGVEVQGGGGTDPEEALLEVLKAAKPGDLVVTLSDYYFADQRKAAELYRKLAKKGVWLVHLVYDGDVGYVRQQLPGVVLEVR